MENLKPTKRKNKLLQVLLERLCNLLEEHTEIFYLERPFLWEREEQNDTKDILERKIENNEAIGFTKRAIKELVKPIPEKAPITEQYKLPEMA